ncbi:GTP-binding protein [Vibrio sp. MACH09]|uniref:Rab family GTPase n=1 Tax=unclassified Vibrio TaxID=2614977 RepID=UPI001493484B|nr:MULTISPECIES: Rab family GTPase [unclassified Vibrio]NOI68758.1 GTP-binding protein [Vibrio sp. 99-8-1]GLO60070.1 GTP-binding protein [Vibrio sp. MACH09]
MIQKKICMLGGSGVGKTSLVKQYVEGIFSEKYLTSIGVKIDKKCVSLDDQEVLLMLWDIEGVDRYAGFNAKFLRGAAAAIVVVDQTRPQSLLDGLEICRLVRAAGNIPITLVINKCDLPMAQTWDIAEHSELHTMFREQYQTSAKTGAGVEELFFRVAEFTVNQQVG